MNLNILRCPQCGGGLSRLDGGYRCDQCAAAFVEAHGVPVLISGVSVESSNFALSDELIDHVLKQEYIADQPENRARLKDIFSTNFRLPNMFLTAENNFYLQRIGLKPDGYRNRPQPDGMALEGVVKYDIPFTLIPDVLPVRGVCSWNVRLENVGERTFFCQGESPFFLFCEIRDEHGELVPEPPSRTALPVDIPREGLHNTRRSVS